MKDIKSTSSDLEQHPRRTSYAYRAAKAVEDVARRMSSPVSMSHLEQHLEKEIKRDAQHPDRIIDIIRVSGEKILHTKKVLLLIVLLNIIDCALVLGELILDIHFVKGMVYIAKDLTVSFVKQLQSAFPWLFHDVELSDVHVFYNKLLDLGDQMTYNSSFTNPALSYNASVSTSGEEVMVYTQKDLPKYLTLRQGCSLQEDLAHAFHKCSISILGILTLITLLKIFCYGSRFFRKKMEILDGIIVISSFVLDLVFIKGLIALPLEDAVEILAFLIPWRVVRVSNSLIMAVMDQGHLKLKMQYKEKKKIIRKLEHANNYNFYYKQVLLALREFCHESGISRHQFHDCVASIEVPESRKRQKKTKLREHLYKLQCLWVDTKSEDTFKMAPEIKSNDNRKIPDFGIKEAVDTTDQMPTSSLTPLLSDLSNRKILKSVLHKPSSRSVDALPTNNNHHIYMASPSLSASHSVHFDVKDDSSDSDSDIADSMFVTEILKDDSDSEK